MSLGLLGRAGRCRRPLSPGILSPVFAGSTDSEAVSHLVLGRSLSHWSASTSARRWVGPRSWDPAFPSFHTLLRGIAGFSPSSADSDESTQLIRLSESMVDIMREKHERHKELEAKLSGDDAASIDASEMGRMTQVTRVLRR